MSRPNKYFGCKVDGCSRKHMAFGYCERHYWQIRNHGKVFGDPIRSKKERNEYIMDFLQSVIIIYKNNGLDRFYSFIDIEDIERCKPYKWGINKKGYACSVINGKNVLLSRFLFNLTNPKIQCDHINRNKLDNRKDNLRICNNAQNSMNIGLRKNNKSGYKGIFWNKEQGKWASSVRYDGKRTHLGYFDNIVEAVKVYNKMVKKYHGEFAYINEIKE